MRSSNSVLLSTIVVGGIFLIGGDASAGNHAIVIGYPDNSNTIVMGGSVDVSGTIEWPVGEVTPTDVKIMITSDIGNNEAATGALENVYVLDGSDPKEQICSATFDISCDVPIGTLNQKATVDATARDAVGGSLVPHQALILG